MPLSGTSALAIAMIRPGIRGQLSGFEQIGVHAQRHDVQLAR